ncbi:hypothetical protein JCM3774_004865, partial [Rhodotorula dairenensis]
LFVLTNGSPLPPTGPPTLSLHALLAAARLSFQDPSLDVDDVESMCVSLMEQGYIKAYILHSKRILVLQKGPRAGFPPVATVNAKSEHESPSGTVRATMNRQDSSREYLNDLDRRAAVTHIRRSVDETDLAAHRVGDIIRRDFGDAWDRFDREMEDSRWPGGGPNRHAYTFTEARLGFGSAFQASRQADKVTCDSGTP